MHFLRRQVYVNCDVCLEIFDLIYSWDPALPGCHRSQIPCRCSRPAHIITDLSPCLLYSIIRPQTVNQTIVTNKTKYFKLQTMKEMKDEGDEEGMDSII